MRSVIGLDNKIYNWVPKSGVVSRPSKLHNRVFSFLKQMFPLRVILQEVSLPGTDGLRADFFMPQIDILVECHGAQHFEYNEHFFETEKDFARYKQNDKRKKMWCELNNITYIELLEHEDESRWREKFEID